MQKKIKPHMSREPNRGADEENRRRSRRRGLCVPERPGVVPGREAAGQGWVSPEPAVSGGVTASEEGVKPT